MKEDEEENILNCKITLVGDSGVGKTSIIGRFVTGIFISDMNSTSGLNFSQKIYEKKGKKICLNIWDTAGQEKFRALGKNFYKDSFIVLIIYDVSDKKSFEDIKEIWYPEIKAYGEAFKILSIVGNKIDKYEEEAVSEEEADSFAKEINAKLFSVSANTGDGIDQMFYSLADNYFEDDFLKKVNALKKERMDSVFLSKEDMSSRKRKGHKGCC